MRILIGWLILNIAIFLILYMYYKMLGGNKQ